MGKGIEESIYVCICMRERERAKGILMKKGEREMKRKWREEDGNERDEKRQQKKERMTEWLE